ncbi:monovalent cation/H+ antiporter complex subunit F [Georgenia satyanarayanai]|uniref:monovalent cation/H+ antiporter complex subunit F n=1 Tax=Georgenia satyanarayanai TaxID=860221 RepID=UPI00203A8FA1|nr:monovalent cation/H+ antiporter complex subunit F [Georgenia satyanarayanai]MCM3660424.1 monovalent cation/H+ antiporter complex subunit F [Georgenia satyanarayanai]
MTVVYVICFAVLLAAGVLSLSRVERGPSMFDRILGVDVTTAVIIGTVALIAAVTKRGDLVPVLIVLALVGFIGSVSIARFAAAESAEEGRILTKDELEDILSQRDAEHEGGPGADEDEDSGSVIVSVESDDDEEHRRRDR